MLQILTWLRFKKSAGLLQKRVQARKFLWVIHQIHCTWERITAELDSVIESSVLNYGTRQSRVVNGLLLWVRQLQILESSRQNLKYSCLRSRRLLREKQIFSFVVVQCVQIPLWTTVLLFSLQKSAFSWKTTREVLECPKSWRDFVQKKFEVGFQCFASLPIKQVLCTTTEVHTVYKQRACFKRGSNWKTSCDVPKSLHPRTHYHDRIWWCHWTQHS